MEALLTAILEDNRLTAKQLLENDPSLATSTVKDARLYESQIYHWLYAGDTALHLAAAGYRIEIARLLLAAGAPANSMENHRRSGPLHYASDGFISAPTWDETSAGKHDRLPARVRRRGSRAR